MPDSRWRTVANRVVPRRVRGSTRSAYHRFRAYVPSPRASARSARLGFGPLGELGTWLADGCLVPPVDTRSRLALYEILSTNPIRVAVETGTLLGDTTAFLALHCERVVTIELSPTLAAAARSRFANTPGAQVVEGDSGKLLAGVLDTIDEPALFWLDGHYSGDGTARGDMDCPLMDELRTIARWPHALASYVVVDDAIVCGEDPAYPTLDELRDFAREVGWDCFTVQHNVVLMHPFPQPTRV